VHPQLFNFVGAKIAEFDVFSIFSHALRRARGLVRDAPTPRWRDSDSNSHRISGPFWLQKLRNPILNKIAASVAAIGSNSLGILRFAPIIMATTCTAERVT